MEGEWGYALERIFGPELVGAAVSRASYPDEPVPRFVGIGNDEALADIRRRALLPTAP